LNGSLANFPFPWQTGDWLAGEAGLRYSETLVSKENRVMREALLHLTEEQWSALEPKLQEAEHHAHLEFFSGEMAKDLLRGGSEDTPGTILLRYLKDRKDETGVRLLRAAELYHHELMRHDLAIAFNLGAGKLEE